MKNLLIAVLVVTTLVVGYIAATSSLRMSMAALTGTTVTIERGDLTLPVNATGEVRPVRRIVLKSEASGEVIAIEREAGQRVSRGDLLIKLRQDDEQRNVDRARLNVTQAEAGLADAKNLLQQARTADIASATAARDQAEATLVVSKRRHERVLESPELYHEDERIQRKSTYKIDKAQLDSAKANLDKAHYAVQRAEQAVIRAQATLESAQTNLADANKQLDKTDIIAPSGNVVAEINTHIGEVIQGGKQNLTGGTVLAVILDTRRLILRAEVDEADIGRVLDLAPLWARPGHDNSERMPETLEQAVEQVDRLATITVETYPDDRFEGIIERIYPEPRTIQNVTTYLVDVVIVSENKDKLLPGMRAEVEFTSEHRENVVLCPNEAIRTGPNGDYGVYVPAESTAEEERPVEFIPCKIGLTDGAMTEIREGIEEGTVVYTRLPAKTRSGNRK